MHYAYPQIQSRQKMRTLVTLESLPRTVDGLLFLLTYHPGIGDVTSGSERQSHALSVKLSQHRATNRSRKTVPKHIRSARKFTQLADAEKVKLEIHHLRCN